MSDPSGDGSQIAVTIEPEYTPGNVSLLSDYMHIHLVQQYFSKYLQALMDSSLISFRYHSSVGINIVSIFMDLIHL